MLKTEFLNKVKEIGTCEDEAQRRALLAEMSDEVSKDYDEIETLKQAQTEYETNMESLRAANMSLFLRLGADKAQEETGADETNNDEKLKFEDLFDEKGGLK